jgi:hypothetical protein
MQIETPMIIDFAPSGDGAVASRRGDVIDHRTGA